MKGNWTQRFRNLSRRTQAFVLFSSALALMGPYFFFDTLWKQGWEAAPVDSFDVLWTRTPTTSPGRFRGGGPRATGVVDHVLEYFYTVDGEVYSERGSVRTLIGRPPRLTRVYFDPRAPRRSTIRKPAHNFMVYGLSSVLAILAFLAFYRGGRSAHAPTAKAATRRHE